MPLSLPKSLQSLLVSDGATSRALQNVKTAVDPLLGFAGSTFQVANDGSLAFLRRIKTFTASAIAATTANITSLTATSVSASSVVSSTGFKSDRDMGVVWVSGAAAGTRYQTKRLTQNNEANNTYNAPTLFQPLYAGSIIGVHVYSQGSAGGTMQVQLYKSVTLPTSSTTAYYQTPAASAAQYVGTAFPLTKGAYPFVANDYFSATVTFTTAGNQFAFVTLAVEYSA